MYQKYQAWLSKVQVVWSLCRIAALETGELAEIFFRKRYGIIELYLDVLLKSEAV